MASGSGKQPEEARQPSEPTAVQIANHSSRTERRPDDTSSSRWSEPQHLLAGGHYLIRVVSQVKTGADHLSVAVQLEGDEIQLQPIL